MNSEKKIVNFLFEIASLRRLTRSHRQLIQDVNDNISDHSFRVAIIGLILAKLEKSNEEKVLKMCIFHDIPEARTGDANLINQQYASLNETEALKDQMKGLPIGSEIKEVLLEREQKKTKEAKIALDADKLDQMVLQQEYFHSDKVNRKKWQDHTEKMLLTRSAKKIAKKIRSADPFDWLEVLIEEKEL